MLLQTGKEVVSSKWKKKNIYKKFLPSLFSFLLPESEKYFSITYSGLNIFL